MGRCLSLAGVLEVADLWAAGNGLEPGGLGSNSRPWSGASVPSFPFCRMGMKRGPSPRLVWELNTQVLPLCRVSCHHFFK